MRKWLFIPVFLLFLCGTVFVSAQTGTESAISGQVFDEHQKPVAFLSIDLKLINRHTVTDKNGFFSFSKLLPGADTLLISGIGYKPTVIAIIISAGRAQRLGTIQVLHDFTQLPGVEITGRASRSYKSDYSYAATKMQAPLKDVPQAVSTITRELMSDKMQFHLNEAITDAAGINLYSGNDEYTIRGFKAENAHLVNGLRIFNSALISPMLVNIDRVEIIKGPTSVLYGNADPGGNINLVTKKPLPDAFAEADVWAGSYQAFRAQTDITGPLSKSKKWLYRLNAGYENTGSFRHGVFNKSFEVAPSFSYLAGPRLQFNADFFVQHSNTIADRGQPGMLNNNHPGNTPVSLSVIQPGDYLKETDASAIFSLVYKLGPHVTLNSAALAYITDQQLAEHGIKNYLTPDSVSLYYTHRNFNTFTVTLNNYATFKFNTGLISHQLLTGYDLVSGAVNMRDFNGEIPTLYGQGSGIVGTFSLTHPVYAARPVDLYKKSTVINTDPGAEEFQTHGLYVQEQAVFGNWQLLLGLRDEFYISGDAEDSVPVSTLNVILPRIGLVYKLSPAVSLYGTYNKGFDPFEVALTPQVFKEPFKPLYSDLLEGGLKAGLFRNKIAATLAVYRLRVKNIAVNANDPSNPDLYTQRGLDQAYGIEGEANGMLIPQLSLSVSYAWNVARIKESTVPEDINSIKENAPRFSGSSWLKYTFEKGKLKGLSFSAGHVHQTTRNTLTRGFTLPEYITLQAGMGYSWRKTHLSFNINNLLNKRYWVGGYNYASIWPGAPRSLMVNVEYFFK